MGGCRCGCSSARGACGRGHRRIGEWKPKQPGLALKGPRHAQRYRDHRVAEIHRLSIVQVADRRIDIPASQSLRDRPAPVGRRDHRARGMPLPALQLHAYGAIVLHQDADRADELVSRSLTSQLQKLWHETTGRL